ncbi:class I SAM-dependent methyltransferase [Marinobacteraceae bacterium S3BR75-40.1]
MTSPLPFEDSIQYLAKQFQQTPNSIARLILGRGGLFAGFESVNVDRIGDDLLLMLYKAPDSGWLDDFLTIWEQCRPATAGRVLLQHRYDRDKAVTDTTGEPLHEIREVEEDGLRYEVELGRTQNYGFFPDMRQGRRWLRARAEGARVMNLFAYTCSFGVAALAGGARYVINVDMSRGVLNRGERNHGLNGQDLAQVVTQKLDIMSGWARLKKLAPADIIVVDPPSNQGKSFNADAHYKRLAKQVAKLCEPGAQVLFCLNKPFVRTDEFRAWVERCGWWDYVERLENPPGVVDREAEKGLKVLVYQRRQEQLPMPDDRD